jgi:hypothetical protein
MKFLVKEITVENGELFSEADPVGNSEEDNSIEDLEDIALDRVKRAPLNKIIEQYNAEKNATDIQ